MEDERIKILTDRIEELAVLAQEKHSGLYSHLYDARLNNVLKRLELEMESDE